MSKTQSHDGRNEQQTTSETDAPFSRDLGERNRAIPSNVLSVNLSQCSDDELAEMYESAKSTYSDDEIEEMRKQSLRRSNGELAEMRESARTRCAGDEADRARERALRGHADEEFARRYNRVRGGPVRPEEVNLVAAPDELVAPPSLTYYDVRKVISEEFGEEGWAVMKPLLATHAALLFDDIESSRAMMIEGQSGVGKTMLLKTFGGLDKQFCRRSGITPASFVSAGPSKSKDDPDNDDLLPQLEGRTLAVRDAQTLFTGSEQTVRSRWGKLARIMDGDGYYRHTATHGKVGYDDIRFNFIGATTPLDPRAWNVMGNVGQRLLFVEWPEEDYEDGWLTSVVDGGERQPIERGREVVQQFLNDLWEYHGGSSSVAWDDERPNEVMEVIEYLAKVVIYARASITNGEPQREAPKRIGQLLHDLARGHALIHGRTRLELGDVEVCGRVALSTMPSKRREIVRALLDPNRDAPLTASDVETILDVSRPTARDRIDDVVALGFGEVVEATGRGGTTKAVEVNSEFRWPDGVPFPEF
ncbi:MULTISPECIES: hypothetical protein [unclassified Haloferax]|uniref:hypothetical protein n=1 Tax=unclassified Haloferax TaxID=2625095 RepID=UPI000E25A555|nr:MULTISPECIES: hypothetical protein [unclassified Haloferax]RDZ35084.1 hypothetical protein C5B88_11720 [Haloferax sp. Atlit-24N]RLM35495.1 hypothetical protein DVK03_11730 [Haloferax sp. Atlit-109R]RLM43340.1 hypothetical protein DVK04_11730 [Haloferax sp. Atlit-105R]